MGVSEGLEGLEWAVERVHAVIQEPERYRTVLAEEIVAALAEPLRQSQRVEELGVINDQLKRIEELEHMLQMKSEALSVAEEAMTRDFQRIEELEAALFSQQTENARLRFQLNEVRP